MARISDILADHRTFSVEVWPPRTPQASVALRDSLAKLSELEPDFASITYGAAGSTRDRTHDLVVEIHNQGHMAAMAHLTCAAHQKVELVAILERYRDAGIVNVLALRGDPPVNAGEPLAPGELQHAVELVELAKEVGNFCVAVAAHPVSHPEAPSREADLVHLAQKLTVADFAITQLFFDTDDYISLVDDLDHMGVDKPIIPGIMPITSARSLATMSRLIGAPVPNAVLDAVAKVEHSPAEVRSFGVDLAVDMASRLLDCGAPGLHFYTMNDTAATVEVCQAVGLGRTTRSC